MTVSLVERAGALTAAIQASVDHGADDETWGQIAQFMEKLSPQVEGLRRQLARSRAVGGAPNAKILRPVRDALTSVREALDKTPDQIGQGTAGKALRDALGQAVKEHGTAADDAWTIQRASVLSEVPDGLLRVYSTVPEARTQSEQASKLRSKVDEAPTAPGNVDDLKNLVTLVKDLRQIVGELQEVALTVGVRAFLDRALEGKGLWSQLTPEVVHWLEERDSVRSLRIKFV